MRERMRIKRGVSVRGVGLLCVAGVAGVGAAVSGHRARSRCSRAPRARVSGMVALMDELSPGISPDDVKTGLCDNAILNKNLTVEEQGCGVPALGGKALAFSSWRGSTWQGSMG
jgi:hypothetical protein